MKRVAGTVWTAVTYELNLDGRSKSSVVPGHVLYKQSTLGGHKLIVMFVFRL